MQNFTLLRFAIPELLEYKNNALVIDPDIFFIGGDPFIKLNILKNAIFAGIRTELMHQLMFLNCANLRSWRLEKIVEGLLDHTIDYNDLINLKNTSLRIKSLIKNGMISTHLMMKQSFFTPHKSYTALEKRASSEFIYTPDIWIYSEGSNLQDP